MIRHTRVAVGPFIPRGPAVVAAGRRPRAGGREGVGGANRQDHAARLRLGLPGLRSDAQSSSQPHTYRCAETNARHFSSPILPLGAGTFGATRSESRYFSSAAQRWFCPTTDTPSHQTAGPGKAAAVARKRRLTCDQWEISASYPQPQYARLATHQRGRSQRVTRRGNALRLRQ